MGLDYFHKLTLPNIQLEILHSTSFLIQSSGKRNLHFRDDKTVTRGSNGGYQINSV